MGHGNSDKLYITHAEHAGYFGSHSSSTGFKAYGISCTFKTRTYALLSERPKHRTPELGHRLTAVLSPSSLSITLYVLVTLMVQEMFST